MRVVKCKTCGTEVNEDVKVCPKCGMVPTVKDYTPEQRRTFKRWAFGTWAILTLLYLVAILAD